jgi:DNA-binding transcriptional LysR family regulator
MRRTLPTTASLTAFETAARRLSFTLAADELAVTQSAVCRQIAALEAALGVKLFRRDGRGVALTEAGAAYARQVRARLDELERDALALMARGGPGGSVGALELGVVPTFATRWLLPRLSGFHAAHPGIQLHLSSRTRPFLFDEARLDAAIHAGTAPWPGTTGRVLLAEQMLPVAAPAWLAAHGFAPDRLPRTAADWQRLVLLQPATRPYAWREWFGSQGLGVAGGTAVLDAGRGCGLRPGRGPGAALRRRRRAGARRAGAGRRRPDAQRPQLLPDLPRARGRGEPGAAHLRRLAAGAGRGGLSRLSA